MVDMFYNYPAMANMREGEGERDIFYQHLDIMVRVIVAILQVSRLLVATS